MRSPVSGDLLLSLAALSIPSRSPFNVIFSWFRRARAGSSRSAHEWPLRRTGWKIVKGDNSKRIDKLQTQTGLPFPPSFRYFLDNYSFPAFELGPLMFFANTGEDIFWELALRLFKDPHMSPALLRAGFLQIGTPFFHNYDPVCFDCKGPKAEKRIIQIDHEEILCNDRIQVIGEIAPSFPELLKDLLSDRAARPTPCER